jgi:hypothetical protein
VKGCVEHAELNVYNGKAMASGFKSHDYEVKEFEAVGKLADLGLGFFNDISIPIYKGYFEIIFTINSNNNVICRWKKNNAARLPTERKIEIKNVYLRVPIIEYSSEARTNLINDLVSNSYFFEHTKWRCIQYLRVTGNSLNINITSAYKSVSNPVWAFVVFQTNRSNNQLKGNSIFYHTKVKNLWIEIAEKRYPDEFWDLNFDNNYYVLAYDAFQDYKRIFIKIDSIQYVNKKGFKSMYPIYSVDLSDQPRNISNVKSDFMLRFNFSKPIPAITGTEEGTTCYIILISNCSLLYELAKNKTTEKILNCLFFIECTLYKNSH